MSSRPEKKFKTNPSKQINLLAEMVLQLSNNVKVLEHNMKLLLAHAHSHPDAPVVGQTADQLEVPTNEIHEGPAWMRTDGKK